jgi:hypothetical protein
MQTYYTIHKFNSKEVKTEIEYLSSNAFKGRLAGTLENKMISQYIKARFEKNRLLPYEGNYIQSFTANYPVKLDAAPYLKVLDKKGKVLTEYKYGEDFKEDMLNFRINQFSFDKATLPQFTKDTIQISKDSNPIIFYVPDKDNLDFRSSFINDSSYSMCLMITRATYSALKEQIDKGYKIECFIPYEVTNTTLDNVVGVIKGKNPEKPPVILSAHFDHVGADISSNVYNGALDNASGVAFVLEMIKYLKSLGTPERDIIFIAFNAEEFGCLGSKAFVEKYGSELSGSKVFNFDMIGSDNSVPLCIMGSKNDTAKTPLIESVSSTCSNENIYYNFLFEDASDHEYFRKQGIEAITFCDNDMSRIHTTLDKADYINTASIDRCFKVASYEVIKYGYNHNYILIYYEKILFTSTLGAMLIIFMSSIFITKKD